MRCLETRTLPNGLRWRRYRRDDGTTFRTYEVPAEVWGSIARNTPYSGRVRDRMTEWTREQDRKKRKARALELIQQGWKPLAVAAELGLTERSIHRYRKELGNDSPQG